MAYFLLTLLVTSTLGKKVCVCTDNPLPLNPAPASSPILSDESLYYLTSRVYSDHFITRYLGRNDWRYSAFYLALDLIIERNAITLVETGTARNGDKACATEGCSTLIFGLFAASTDRKYYSVDNNSTNCAEIGKFTNRYEDNIEIVKGDSVEYLKNFNKGVIDFLLLDSEEYDRANPEFSQKYKLEEINSAYDKLHQGSIIVLNNCEIDGRNQCALAQQALIEKGWKLRREGLVQLFTYS